jgi:hypothetical protein
LSLDNVKSEYIVSATVIAGIIIALILIPSWQDDQILIIQDNAGGSESTQCINLGTQYQIVLNSTDGDCFIRSLANGTGITVSTNTTHIIINSTASSGETTVCSNLGSVGEGIVATSSNGNCDFKKLLAGTGISLSSNGTRITITNTLPESTVCTNLNNSTGFGICRDDNVNLKSLIEGTGIDLTSNSTNITIASPYSVQAQTYLSVAKTNIGTSYVDIYTTAFDLEELNTLDLNNAKQARIFYLWDYVGTGNHQLRWCEATFGGCNASNIFFETSTFNSDCGGNQNLNCDSGWFDIPSWAFNLSDVDLIWQGKSTVAGDDPIAKGYKIMVR